MNNFDRPRGITMDERFEGEIANITAPGVVGYPTYTTEYTSWTALSDLRGLRFSVRGYDSLNYVDFDLSVLMKETDRKTIKLGKIPADITDGTKVLQEAD